MVSIVSTAQANLIDEDAYSKKRLKGTNRTCGTWGTAFCCLNLRKSIILITILYAIMYIFNRLSLIFISITRNEYQKLQLQIINKRFDIEGILGIEVGYISNYFREIFNFVLDSYICNAFNSYLELSSYISGVIFFVGLLLTFIGWFWLTATLLGLIWLDFVKSTSATFFFSFLIIRKTYLNIGLFLIIPILLFFLIIFAFYYYSIQVVYSLYLVQLAGGRGDEYLSYFRLRRMIQNNTKQNTRFTERTYGDKNKSNETSSLIREHDAETNV